MKNQNFKSFKSFLFVALLALGIMSCDKDKNDPAPGGGNDNGVEGKWKIAAITVDPAQDGITDYLAYLEALTGNHCLSSIIFEFKGNGSIDGVVPQGCSDEAEDSDVLDDKATWQVVGNKIQLKEGNDITEYDLQVSKTEMKWSQQETEDGVSYKYTLVFKRQ
ncbi:lipocalin-like domain-containing protein [Dyadobacter sandarakinus]|uniref:Lipocalin family protein n=1 Tax=Dyadobacter sandarakinus TaxID=2747268 RepID=A0ABX7IDB8_9BACT|nr:lipocalin family protein [Dyadobacter sandarakinus]QRR03517.1 lipocalin family protein [Dyadobacter sandarakinus]